MKFTAKIDGMINPRTTKPVTDINVTLKDKQGRLLYQFEKPLSFQTKVASKIDSLTLLQSSLVPLMPSNYTLEFSKERKHRTEKDYLLITTLNCVHFAPLKVLD